MSSVSTVCAAHRVYLADANWHGARYHHPLCLECLPHHGEKCEQAAYLEQQAFWYGQRLRRFPDFDLSDSEFKLRFGEIVPPCTCPTRPHFSNGSTPGAPHTSLVFRLVYAQTTTAWMTESRCIRLARVLFEEAVAVDAVVELGEMSHHRLIPLRKFALRESSKLATMTWRANAS